MLALVVPPIELRPLRFCQGCHRKLPACWRSQSSHPSGHPHLQIYASPISLTPRHYAIGLYQNTLSRENMLATRRGVLQVLSLAWGGVELGGVG